MTVLKKCNTCHEDKPLDDFYLVPRHNGGRNHKCAECCRKHALKYHKENPKQRIENNKKYYQTPIKRAKIMFDKAKKRALDRGLLFDMTLQRVVVPILIGKCEASGVDFDFMPHDRYDYNPFAPAIDRKNSFLGYTNDNVQIVCNIYNLGKNQYDEEQYLSFCEQLLRFRKRIQ